MSVYLPFDRFKTRLLLIILAITVAVLTISFTITYWVFFNQLQKSQEDATIKSFEKTEENIDWLLTNAQTIALSMQFDRAIVNFLHQDSHSELDSIEVKRNLIKSIDTVLSSYDYLSSIMVFNASGEMGGSSIPRSLFNTSSYHPFTDCEDYQAALDMSPSMVWRGGYTRHYFSQSMQKDPIPASDLLILGIRAIKNYTIKDTSENRSVIAIAVKEPAIRDLYQHLSDEGQVVVLDYDGRQISGSDFSSYNHVPEFYHSLDRSAQYGSLDSSVGLESQIIYYRMKSTGWLLVKTIPLAIYRQQFRIIRNIMLMIVVGTLLLISGLYIFGIIRFARPLDALADTMAQVSQGNLAVRVTEKSSIREFKLLNHQLNLMLDNINDLLVKTSQMEQEKRVLEIEALQAQINPHFIYNTITSIRWMAQMSGSRHVSDALVLLVKLLRPIFSKMTLIWTLDEEMTFLTNYLALMQIRFGDKTEVQVDIDPSVGSYLIPRFVLQPILENSFEHASAGLDKVILRLRIVDEAKQIRIEIGDTGNGMPSDRAQKIQTMLEPSAERPTEQNSRSNSHGVGLFNVRRRLSLYYGESGNFTIVSESGKGTITTLIIPKAMNSDKLSY